MATNTPIHGEVQLQPVLNAMRFVLVIVSIGALAAIAITVWLYMTKLPQIKKQQQEIARQSEDLSRIRGQLGDSCVKLATLENESDHKEESVQTLDKCMVFFPNDPTLPAYKAQVMTSIFIEDPKKSIPLDYALQAADTSINISKSINSAPPVEAIDWKGIAYCLQARSSTSPEREIATQNAIKAFQSEPTARLKTLGAMTEFQTYCPVEVKTALHVDN
jgi:hypothetical protein